MVIRKMIDKLKKCSHKATLMSLALVLFCGLIIQGTFAWIHLGQDVSGALIYFNDKYPVELYKYERNMDGSYTTIPMEDVGFALFKEDGTQIGAVYYTDAEGKIRLDLPIGKYYWKETHYKNGWGPDFDDMGMPIFTYPFEVTQDNDPEIPMMIKVYNLPIETDELETEELEVSKTVVNPDGSELTPEQLDQEFEFIIEFSDGGTYRYYIKNVDDIESDDPKDYIDITSGDKFYLKHHQVAVFENLPLGVVYKVIETQTNDYHVSSNGHTGNIVVGENKADFINTYHPRVGSLLVSKEVQNADGSALTQEQLDKEFLFTATIDGEEVQFVLKHGQEHLIPDLPVGTKYKVEEFDYIGEHYYATTLIYEGEIRGEYQHLLPFVNVYHPVNETGDLIVRKELIGEDAELDFELEFEFEITLEYPDERDDEVITFKLKADPMNDPSLWKIFEDLPLGTKYTIKEMTNHGYIPVNDVIVGYIYGVNDDASNNVENETIEPEIDDSNSEELLPNPDETVPTETPEIETEEETTEDTENLEGLQRTRMNEPSLESGQVVTFYNRLPDYKIIEITKEVTGKYPAIDEDKEFLIRLYIDDELFDEFTLTAGEMKSFKVPANVRYEVWEQDYSGDGYSQVIINGYGSLIDEITEVTVINHYDEKETEEDDDLVGEKTWSKVPGASDYIPESIIVRLMLDGVVIEEKTVVADEFEKWEYTFDAPKYDDQGNAYDYTVQEVPVDMFYPVYDGLNIHNEFIEPINMPLPKFEKQVIGHNAPEEKFTFVLKGIDGAPMPVGSDGKELEYVLYGPGEQLLGNISFVKPGVYKYSVYEVAGNDINWIYDETIYEIEVTVKNIDGKLVATYKITDGENEVDEIIFVNEFDLDDDNLLPTPTPTPSDEKVAIIGHKTWIHGSNPEANQPKSLIIYIYANGELVQTILTDAENNWNYAVQLPKYDKDGNIIEYTVEEEVVDGYTGEKDGFNFTNRFIEKKPPVVDTSDQLLLLEWLAMMLASGIIVLSIILRKRLQKSAW